MNAGIGTRRANRHRGTVLIVVLGVLAVLALLATTFANLQSIERNISHNYLDQVRARILAHAGIEDALARLSSLMPSYLLHPPNASQSWIYFGNDTSETAPQPNVSLASAKNPSFACENESLQNPSDSNTSPKLFPLNGQLRGFSAGDSSTGSYAAFSDHYALKVTDCSGLLFVNDGLDPGPTSSVSRNLQRLLNILGLIVGVSDLGDKILSYRSTLGPQGYTSKRQLLAAVGYSESDFVKFKHLVTVHAWVDPDVANPVPLSQAALSAYPKHLWPTSLGGSLYRGNPPLFRINKGKDAAGTVLSGDLKFCPPASFDDPAIRVYGLDVLNPQYVEVVKRAPVNVNTTPREVLVALLTDLEGFFLSDRRRNNPNWQGSWYTPFSQKHPYGPGALGDEIGFLYQTIPIVGPNSSGMPGISASVLADEIIACRQRKPSPNTPFGATGIDYSSVWWGGPFTSWRQFHQFCDHLAESGFLEAYTPAFYFDLFKDFDPNNCDHNGYGPLVSCSTVQKRHVLRAFADMLKANFNPNLHLNELNPDENLYLRVDKTDLIVNSTEFCFLPTGYFEIESLGRIVRPTDNAPDISLASDNRLMATSSLTATVKLYDLLRHTSQKHFWPGSISPRSGPFESSNNRSLQIGPEPDNGSAPSENEFDGTIALPTIGGDFHPPNQFKLPNTLAKTIDLAPKKQFDSDIHAHFSWDFDAHYHSLNQPLEIAGRTVADENVSNHPDVGASGPGPYAPNTGPGNLHRLARSFRLSAPGSMAAPLPNLSPQVPSDLRIDGAYVERNCGISYSLSKGNDYVWNFTQENAQGQVSFWVKPSFFPELTGKVRTLWDLSRYHTPCGSTNIFPFWLLFFPTHFNPSVSESVNPNYGSNGMGKHHPMSLTFGHLQWHDVPYWSVFGNISKSLNHIGHPDEATKPSVLKAHRWTNLTLWWKLDGMWDYNNTSSGLLINGSTNLVPFNTKTYAGWAHGFDKMFGFEAHSGGERNHMRLGNPSKICEAADAPWRGNQSGDWTVDEFHLWKHKNAPQAQTLWLRGRYTKPWNSGEATFTSTPLFLPGSTSRVLPPISAAAPPIASGPPLAAASTNSTGGSLRILALAWTWFGEDLDATGKPTLYDYNTSGTPSILDPSVRVRLKVDGTWYGPYLNDSLSLPSSPSEGPLFVNPSQPTHYEVEFALANANAGTILLATPVLDDLTIYYAAAASPFVSYQPDF